MQPQLDRARRPPLERPVGQRIGFRPAPQAEEGVGGVPLELRPERPLDAEARGQLDALLGHLQALGDSTGMIEDGREVVVGEGEAGDLADAARDEPGLAHAGEAILHMAGVHEVPAEDAERQRLLLASADAARQNKRLTG